MTSFRVFRNLYRKTSLDALSSVVNKDLTFKAKAKDLTLKAKVKA